MDKITIPAKLENLDDLIGFIEGKLEEYGASMKVNMQVQLSCEEIFANIASYAYPDREDGTVEVQMELLESETSDVSGAHAVRIIFIDSGVAYDPLARENPDIGLDAEERQIGGLGIFLVKKSMDRAKYEYVDGKNKLTIEKDL